MHWLDPFLLKFKDEKALSELKEALQSAEQEGFSRIHIQGKDFILKDCEFVWTSSELSKAARLLGAQEEGKRSHAWYLEDKSRMRRVDLPTFAEALKRELKWRGDEF
jgi:hypothetical protein